MSQSSHQFYSTHCLQVLILCGITTPIPKDFFQLKGTFAFKLSPPILKYSFLSNLSDTFVNPSKVLCSSITPYLFIVKRYFFSVLRTILKKYLRLYNHSFLVAKSYQLKRLYLFYANFYFQNTNYSCLRNKHRLYKMH